MLNLRIIIIFKLIFAIFLLNTQKSYASPEEIFFLEIPKPINYKSLKAFYKVLRTDEGILLEKEGLDGMDFNIIKDISSIEYRNEYKYYLFKITFKNALIIETKPYLSGYDNMHYKEPPAQNFGIKIYSKKIYIIHDFPSKKEALNWLYKILNAKEIK